MYSPLSVPVVRDDRRDWLHPMADLDKCPFLTTGYYPLWNLVVDPVEVVRLDPRAEEFRVVTALISFLSHF